MSCEDCERFRDSQARTHRSYLARIGNASQEAQTTKPPNDLERELQDAYNAAAAEYKGHVATAHPFRLRTRRGIRAVRKE